MFKKSFSMGSWPSPPWSARVRVPGISRRACFLADARDRLRYPKRDGRLIPRRASARQSTRLRAVATTRVAFLIGRPPNAIRQRARALNSPDSLPPSSVGNNLRNSLTYVWVCTRDTCHLGHPGMTTISPPSPRVAESRTNTHCFPSPTDLPKAS